MGAIASQITSLTIVYSIVYSDAYQRKHQSSASLAFVWRIHRGPVNSPHKWPVTRTMFPFDDVILTFGTKVKTCVPEVHGNSVVMFICGEQKIGCNVYGGMNLIQKTAKRQMKRQSRKTTIKLTKEDNNKSRE